MKERGLIVVDLEEISRRWQIPVERIKYFITDCGMPLTDKERGQWFSDHADLILQEKQKVFEDDLFPERFRSPTATSAKTS
jgi:hypothetical protein